MRQNKHYFLAGLILLGIVTLKAQPTTQTTTNWCGTHGYSPWLDWYNTHPNELAQYRDLDTAWLYVPVTVHLVSNDLGGGGYPEGQVFRIICEMNEQYADARIRFYFMPGEPFFYHANSSWYEHDWDGGADLIQSTIINDRLNAYIVSDPAGNCGYSWLDAIVMGRGCSGPGNSTWAHEAGHHFSLPHPFFGWEGHNWNFTSPAPPEWDGYEVEKMDGSNCLVAGDRICDTKPDYLNYRWGCDNNQLSTVQQQDPNGVLFRSDASLYMSYSLDACSSRFTPGQIEAMRMNLYTEHSVYLQASSPDAEINDNVTVNYISPIDSTVVQYNNVVLEWEPVENAAFYQVEVSNSPNFSIIFFSDLVVGNTATTVNKNIPNNYTLYWRVKPFSSWDVCGNTAWQQPAVFKTKNLSATNDLERVADISLTPNPVAAGTAALIRINSSESLDMLLTMHDASGRLCLQQQMKMYAGDNSYRVETADLQAGFYFATLQTQKGTLVKRLVVTE